MRKNAAMCTRTHFIKSRQYALPLPPVSASTSVSAPLCLAVWEAVTDEGGGDAGPAVVTTQVPGLLHVQLQVESSVGDLLLPQVPRVSAGRGGEIPTVKTHGETGFTLVELLSVGQNLRLVEDVDNVPLGGFTIKHNLGIDVSSEIANTMQNIESVNIDMGTNSLD